MPNPFSLLVGIAPPPPTSTVDDVSFENLRDIWKEADKDEKEMILTDDTHYDLKSHQKANTKKLKMIHSEKLVRAANI